jgi:hypothetical protein
MGEAIEAARGMVNLFHQPYPKPAVGIGEHPFTLLPNVSLPLLVALAVAAFAGHAEAIRSQGGARKDGHSALRARHLLAHATTSSVASLMQEPDCCRRIATSRIDALALLIITSRTIDFLLQALEWWRSVRVEKWINRETR